MWLTGYHTIPSEVKTGVRLTWGAFNRKNGERMKTCAPRKVYKEELTATRIDVLCIVLRARLPKLTFCHRFFVGMLALVANKVTVIERFARHVAPHALCFVQFFFHSETFHFRRVELARGNRLNLRDVNVEATVEHS